MGWSGGTDIGRAVAESISKHVADPKLREKIYKPIYEELSGADWDTTDEATGIDPVFDKVMGFDMDYHAFEPRIEGSILYLTSGGVSALGVNEMFKGKERQHLLGAAAHYADAQCRCCGFKRSHKLHSPRPKKDQGDDE